MKPTDINFSTLSPTVEEVSWDGKQTGNKKQKQKDELSPQKCKIDTTIEISKSKDSEEQAVQIFQQQKAKIEKQEEMLRSLWGELSSVKKHYQKMSICYGMQLRKNERDKKQLKKLQAKCKTLKNKEIFTLSSNSEEE